MQFYNAKIFSVVGSKKSPWLNSAPPILKFIKYKQLSDTFQLSILLVNNTESYTFLCITNTAWVQYGHLEIVALTLLDKKWLLYDAKAEIFQYSLSTMLPFRFLLFGGPSSWRQWPTAPTLSPSTGGLNPDHNEMWILRIAKWEMGADIAQWICLRLPSSGPGFDPQPLLHMPFQAIFDLWWEKDKKRLGFGPFLKNVRIHETSIR